MLQRNLDEKCIVEKSEFFSSGDSLPSYDVIRKKMISASFYYVIILKIQNELKNTEQNLNHRKDEMVRELQQRLEQEKDAHALSERNGHAMR